MRSLWFIQHRFTVTGLFAAVFFGLLAHFSFSPNYFSVVRVQNAELSTTIVSHPVSSPQTCQAALQSQLQNIHAACPSCQTAGSQCDEQLGGVLRLLFTNAPLTTYSALLPSGFAVFEATSTAVAQQACLQSEQQSHAKGFWVRCYGPNEPRLVSTIHKTTPILSLQSLWLVLAAACFFVAAMQLGQIYNQPIARKALKLSRRHKQLFVGLYDLVAIEVCLYLALAIKLESIHVPLSNFLPAAWLAPLFALPVFVKFGLYNAVMRYIGIHAMVAIAKAVAVYALLLTLWLVLAQPMALSASLVVMHCLLTLMAIGASRAVARRWLSQVQNHGNFQLPRKRALVYGAGSAGVQLALALAQSREIMPVAFVDDDEKLHHKQIAGLTVHARAELEMLIHRQHISEVLLALPSISRATRNNIISELEKLPVQVRTLPGVAQLAEGKVKTSDLREVDIEDLLGRDPVPPKIELLQANIKHKAVMVTGAGGSIGSELCRQILMHQPTLLVLYELNEFALYTIEQELLSTAPEATQVVMPILGSVTDSTKLDLVLKRFNIQAVFHAAAYKHVPMVEKNPCAGAFNNIVGTWHTATAAQRNGVETFVLISTDKAVRPTNTMGTTKRVAELVLQALNQVSSQRTRFVMVRFGNVLGSSGSVLPVFKEQIKNGGPVTVTDPRIIRYFMTIPEAAQLVIQAGAMGQGGDVFVLDMGEPVKILDMARKMIRLSGLSVRDEDNPSGDIEIAFSGLRPGEKLYEELLIGDDVTPTSHPRILRANEHMLSFEATEKLCRDVEKVCVENDSDGLRSLLQNSVSEFMPQCGNEDLLA